MNIQKGEIFSFPEGLDPIGYTYRCLEWGEEEKDFNLEDLEITSDNEYIINDIVKQKGETWVTFDWCEDHPNPFMIRLKDFQRIFNITSPEIY